MTSQLGAAELGNFELGSLDSGGGSNINLFPGPGTITLTGGTPTVSFSGTGTIALFPAAGAITLTGGTPTVALSGGIGLSPGAGSIALTGGTPEVFLETGIPLHPGPGVISLTGGTPTVTASLMPGAGQIQITTFRPGVSLVRTVGTGDKLYIGDTSYIWHESTFRVTKVTSGAWSAAFEIDFFGGYDPQSLIDQKVALFWNSVKRFGGLIQSITEVGKQGNSGGSSLEYSRLKVACTGYGAYVDRVVYAKLVTTALGTVTGEMVYNFWYDKLAQFGVTKVGDAPNHAVPEQLFHYITGSEVLNRIKEQDPGYDWWIDDNIELHYEPTDPAGGATAPFTLRNGDSNHDFMEVTKSNVKFRNRQFVLPSADLQALRDDARVADGVSTAYSTDYNLNSKPIVRVAGVAQLVVQFGDFVTGWQFYYIPGSVGVFSASVLGFGTAVDILYPNPFPVAEMAEDAASIAAVGPYEAIWQAKNVYDRLTAQQIAQGFIDAYADGGYQIKIVFEYNSDSQAAWLVPGDIVDVNTTFPTALGNFAVEQIESQEIGLTVWKHTVTMRGGIGEVTETQALQAAKIAARVPIDSPPYQLPWSLFEDVSGLTNPGAAAGAIKLSHTIQTAGVVASWQIICADDPPDGDDFIMDVLVNGVSIMPVLDADKVVAEDGVTTLQQGIRFLVENTPVAPGDIVTLNVLQVGSTFGGANFTFYLNIKVTGNVGQV